jgi:hypothetical protein
LFASPLHAHVRDLPDISASKVWLARGRDLGYQCLAGVGRLQTDADRARVVDGLSGVGDAAALANTIKRLAPRWFVVRNVHAQEGSLLSQPRYAMSFMRGPMTRTEIRVARERLSGGKV